MGPVRSYWRVPDRIRLEPWVGGELLALRCWRLAQWSEDGGVRLQSVSRLDLWHGPVFTADHVPLAAEDCGSGVYAIKASHRPRTDEAGALNPPAFDWLTGPTTWVWGWVALLGQVVEHAHGYRAQMAVVRRLHLGVLAHLAFGSPQALAWLMRQLEDRYQCPVRPGYWEPRKASRIRSHTSYPATALPHLALVGQPSRIIDAPSRPAAAPDQPQQLAPAATPSTPPAAPTSRPAAPAGVPAPAATARRPRWPPSKDVVRAFQKAERERGAKWQLMGRGHCRRVTLHSWYSRFVRLATTCWLRFTPHESAFRVIVFPLAVVRRAARILRVKAEVLIGQEY